MAPIPASVPSILVDSAHGIYLPLADGSEVIDRMSSWSAACHGHSHPALVKTAPPKQVHTMSHVMFGGLTRRPAIDLARKLLDICIGALEPNASEQSSASEEASGSTQASAREQLDAVFFSDSGSVSVEVEIKMALQYQAAIGPRAQTPRNLAATTATPARQ